MYYCRIIFLNILKTALRAKTKLIVILVKTQLEIEDTIGEKIMQGIQNSSKLLQTKAWLSCSVIGRPNVLHDALYHNA